MNHDTVIKYSLIILFAIIATSAFSLSFLNLMEVAKGAGIIENLSWMWPLCIDSFILMGSLFVLQSNLHQEPSWQGWVVVGVFTMASIGFNISHSPDDLISRAVHASFPIALCGSLEALMIQIQREVQRYQVEFRKIDLNQSEEGSIDPDTAEKVEMWFKENPGRSIDDARKALKMRWASVRDYKNHLTRVGRLPRD